MAAQPSREGVATLDLGPSGGPAVSGRLRLRVSCLTEDPLAGGPVELQAVIESAGAATGHLAVTADRARQRPGDYFFQASLADLVLTDPYAGASELGGPGGAVDLASGLPLTQTLLLNQYLDLERLSTTIDPGDSAVLAVRCRRRVAVGTDPLSALSQPEPATAEVELGVPVRRDDAAVAALIDDLATRAAEDPAAAEAALTTLFALRSKASEQRLRELASSAGPTVRSRIIAFLNRPG